MDIHVDFKVIRSAKKMLIRSCQDGLLVELMHQTMFLQDSDVGVDDAGEGSPSKKEVLSEPIRQRSGIWESV